jgi:mannosyltransferase
MLAAPVSLRRLTRPQLILLVLVVAGAAVRFATLATQSFWIDEGYTVHLLRGSLGHMVHGIPRTEETPPLYYVLAWLWTRPFGTGEAGVRSLSALCGTAAIPVAYLLGRRLLSERAGLATAALAAVNPLLVWYSQEARTYALFVLLSGLSILLFLRAREESSGRALGLWATVSALALASHYFAIFVVVPEAAWLLLRARAPARRAAAWAVAAVGIVGAALLPLAIHQSGNEGARFIHGTSIVSRLGQVPKQFLAGYALPSQAVFTAGAAALAAGALLLLFMRADERARRGAAIACVFVLLAAGVPLIVALAGADYLITRNVIAGWLPLGVVLAAGFGAARAPRAGTALAALLCALSLAAVIEVDAHPAFQRDDWRGAARALGPARVTRALVVSPLNGLIPLGLYAPGLHRFPAGGLVQVTEIDLLGVAVRRAGETPRPPRPVAFVPHGFRQVLRLDRPTFTFVHMVSTRPIVFSFHRLYGERLDPRAADVLIQTPR